MRRNTALAMLLAVTVVVLVSSSHASLLNEYSREQLFLMQRRQLVALADGVAVTRGLAPPSAALVSALPARHLQQLLEDRHAPCVGCLERQELVDHALRARHTPSWQDTVTQELVVTDAAPLLSPHAYNEHRLSLTEALTGATCTIATNGTVSCLERR